MRHHRWVLAAALAVLFVLAPAAIAQRSTGRAVANEAEFRPISATDAAVLEIQIPDPASGRSQRRAISDLMVRIALPGGDVAAALRAGNGVKFEREVGLFRAHIYVVSAGRLLRDIEARCDRWVDDLAVCSALCEGGTFGLRRVPGQSAIGLSLILGRVSRGEDVTVRAGVSFDACADGTSQEQLLVPAAGRSDLQISLRQR